MKLTADIVIRGELDSVWNRTQAPAAHVRWDLRFTDIEYLPKSEADGPQYFRYATRIGFGCTIEGWSETVGEHEEAPKPGESGLGTRRRGSVLRFGSDDAKSLIREGSGFWAYESCHGGVRFNTAYDYRVRYGLPGRVLDGIVLRPLMVWGTRWSFDRLRLWIERDVTPELLMQLWLVKLVARVALGLVWVWEGLDLSRSCFRFRTARSNWCGSRVYSGLRPRSA